MLAKVVAHGRDRRQALRRLTAALDDTIVLGVVTNLRFLRWLVRQPVVLEGQARIDTLDRIWPPDGWAERATVPEQAWNTAARLLQPARPDPWSGGWRLNARPTIRIESEGERRNVVVADDVVELPAVRAGDRVYIDVAGRSVAFALAHPPDVDRAARAAATHATGGAATEIQSPMPGSVLAIHVGVDDQVEAGTPVATIEAMKMEHVVAAPMAGRVAELLAARADQVTRGQLLAIVEPTPET
jgi:acetyl-CoA/propionyl-CoA carboxylase biotin carboxyl carrier protein